MVYSELTSYFRLMIATALAAKDKSPHPILIQGSTNHFAVLQTVQ